MSRLHLALIVCAVLLFPACKKSSSTAPQTYPSYSNLAVGNYWVYRIFDLDSNYNVTDSTNITDSIYVDNDTIIAGHVYYKYWQPQIDGITSSYYVTYLRDSLDYIVNNYGAIYFSSEDFTTIFYDKYFVDTAHITSPVDTPYHVQRQMADKDKVVTVPAGTYVTSSCQTTYFMNQFFAQSGPVVRKLSTRYSAGVGMVSQTMPFYASIPNYTERRLIRYHASSMK